MSRAWIAEQRRRYFAAKVNRWQRRWMIEHGQEILDMLRAIPAQLQPEYDRPGHVVEARVRERFTIRERMARRCRPRSILFMRTPAGWDVRPDTVFHDRLSRTVTWIPTHDLKERCYL